MPVYFRLRERAKKNGKAEPANNVPNKNMPPMNT